ncbi:MAG: ADP-ribosylglycohydrolase family protein, partial [Eubacteriales bacterium]|nr:ADP-ribosylglycohydrolase family protein [Eubacteriales bacterium]
MKLAYDVYMKKLYGCFTGKAVGGTLGMPMEGYIGTKDITYYDPVPTSMVANDDLDLQAVWVEVIRRCGLPINRRDLADGWLRHMKALPDEYGVVIRNLKTGLYPPLSGYYDNKFTSGMGSAIRTEIWAALAPGDPELAVMLSREDACCDHWGDGVEASAFLAAIESAAYIESDRTKLIETGLRFIEPGGRLDNMLRSTMEWWDRLRDPLEVRERILKEYFVQNWTDVGINMSFILIGWLAGDAETEA